MKDAAADRPISFKLDVMPVFMRAGCNTGSCHGAARGKDGFRLSLFGYDPRRRPPSPDPRDRRPPHQPGLARREPAAGEVRPAPCRTPAASGSSKDSEYYQTLLRWLEAGAPNDPPTVPTVGRRRALSASRPCSKAKGATQQFIVRAKYSDGTDRDVTNLAVFLTNNDNSAADRRRTAW